MFTVASSRLDAWLAYSPECVEGVFSEVEHSPGPTPMGVSDVDLPASRYYPDFLIIPNGRTLPHDGLGRLDRDRAELRLNGVLGSTHSPGPMPSGLLIY